MRLAALASLAALVVLPACALALGVQDDPMVAAHDMCMCPEIQVIEKNDCQSLLETRLALTTPDVRAAWLQTYATSCTNCADAPTCFYQAPTCVGPTNACTSSPECCSYHPISNRKACTGGFCR